MNTFKQKLACMLATTCLIACSSIQESEFDKRDALCPNVENGLAFEAAASLKYEVQVMAQVGKWDAVSDQDWCKIEKSERTFVVTSLPNVTFKERKATISVMENGVVKQKIDIEQNAAASGEIDMQKNYWDDTHWRLYGLKGRVKDFTVSMYGQFPYFLHFNLDGKLVKFNYLWDEEVVLNGYDKQGRIIKQTAKRGDGITYECEFEYGDHTKYIYHDMRLLQSDPDMHTLTKGLTKVKTTSSYSGYYETKFEIDNNTVTSNGNTYSLTMKYTGNYPREIIVKTSLVEEKTNTYTFTYTANGMYASHFADFQPSGLFDKHNYSTESPFLNMLNSESETHTSEHEYDLDWNWLKTTTNYATSPTSEPNISYTKEYVVDQQGNWIERIFNGFKETRTITYYE